MSGHSRRTSTSVSPPLGVVAAGAGSGSGVGSGSSCAAGSGSSCAAGSGSAPPARRRRLGCGGRDRGGGDRLGLGGRDLDDRLDRVLDGWRGRVLADRGRARRTPGDGGTLLEPVDPRQQAGLRGVGAGQQHPGADQLEQQPRRGRSAHVGEAGRDQVGGPAELGRPEPRRLRDEPVGLVLGDVDQPGGRGVRHGRHDHEVAQPTQQVLGEPARVLPGLDHPVDHAEDGRSVTGGEGVDHVVEQRRRGVAEQAGGEVVGDAVGAGPAQQLVEDRQRVARRAGAGAHDEGQRRGLDA